jgi:hypothetical protein
LKRGGSITGEILGDDSRRLVEQHAAFEPLGDCCARKKTPNLRHPLLIGLRRQNKYLNGFVVENTAKPRWRGAGER